MDISVFLIYFFVDVSDFFQWIFQVLFSTYFMVTLPICYYSLILSLSLFALSVLSQCSLCFFVFIIHYICDSRPFLSQILNLLKEIQLGFLESIESKWAFLYDEP